MIPVPLMQGKVRVDASSITAGKGQSWFYYCRKGLDMVPAGEDQSWFNQENAIRGNTDL